MVATKVRTRRSWIPGDMRAAIFCSARPRARFGGVSAQFQRGRFRGRGDLFHKVRLNLGHFGDGFAPDALRFGFGFLLRAAAQRLDFGLQIGEAAIHFRDLGVGGGARGFGVRHTFANFERPLGEVGAGVLLDHVTQTARQQRQS